MDSSIEEKENLVLPKGNWTKQLKFFPKKFDEGCIEKHFNRNKAKKHFQNGYRMYKAGKVLNVQLSIGLKEVDLAINQDYTLFIKSKVQASFTLAAKYDVATTLSGSTGMVERGKCNCKAGKGGVCIHVSALLWHLLDCHREGLKFIPDDQACTEKKRVWGVPNAKGALLTKKFENLNFVRHVPGKSSESLKKTNDKLKLFNSLRDHGKDHDNENMKCRIEKLCNRFNKVPKRKFLSRIQEENNFMPETAVTVVGDKEVPIVDVQMDLARRIPLPVQIFDIRQCNENSLRNIEDATAKTSSVLKITLDAAQSLECETKDQSNCEMWKAERLERITASKFGAVCKRKKEATESFLKSITTGTDLSRNKYAQEGLNNEKAATEKYQVLRGNVETFSVGFCVNPSLPMLGASPDRLVLDKTIGQYGLLEIKTLSKCKFGNISIKEAVERKEATAKFLKLDENDSLTCDRKHNHYFQIQGQMGISGLPWCDLIVDCGDDKPFVERIEFNEDFFKNDMLPKLTNFYASHVIPFLKK